MQMLDFSLWLSLWVAQWQALALTSAFWGKVYVLLSCGLVAAVLFLTGTALGLCLQSLWAIFIRRHSGQPEE